MGDNLLAMRLLLLAAISAVLASPGTAFPANPPDSTRPTADTLDRSRVQAEYGDGNFEVVIEILEGYRSSHKAFQASDSLFLAKYLGVVYASNPASREKGKYWLYRMLQIDPAADLVDMYVGEAVDKAFERVRQEFIVRRNYRGINDMKLAKSVSEGERTRDTVVVRDTVKLDPGKPDSLPERRLKDFRHGWTGNLNLGVGLKLMDKVEWDATRQHKEFRLALDIRQQRWPINIAFDVLYSRSEENLQDLGDGSSSPYRQISAEINGGVRKIFDRKLYSMRPLVGGGFGYIGTWLPDYDLPEGYEIGGGTLGAWAEGGVYWELERHFNIGAEVLWSWAEINVLGVTANPGGFHFEMIFGYHW